MRNISLTLCLILAALAAGCSNAPATMPDTRTADIQAVKDVEAAWLKDTDSKDSEKWASYFADDGSGLYPGMGIVTGRAALKTAMTPFFADPNFKLSFQSTRAVASKGGDMVYSQGTYTLNMTDPKTKKLMTDKGKYLTIYMKQADGSWKATADTFNSDSAM